MPSAQHRRLALVIEDDDSLRLMMCEMLELAGFETYGCRDGCEGLDAARRLRPSVLTLDLHMPGMDGLEVLERLGSEDATAALPVVVVSAYTAEGRSHFTRQVRAVVAKPFEVTELWEKVAHAADG